MTALETENGSPAKVVADRQAVNAILRNLMTKAIKFTPKGGRVTIRARDEGAMVPVSVTDTGVGMSREKIGKLFSIAE